MDDTNMIPIREDKNKIKEAGSTSSISQHKVPLPMVEERECITCFCYEPCFLFKCDHFYCMECLKEFIEFEIDLSKIPITCAGPNCLNDNLCEDKYEPEWIFGWLGDDIDRKNKFAEFLGGENDAYDQVIKLLDCERRLSSGAKFTPVNYLQILSPALQKLFGADFYRLGVWADGCCFYHCVWEATDSEYQKITGVRNENRQLKRNTGQNKRISFGKTIQEKDIKDSGIISYNANDPNKANLTYEMVLANIADPTNWAGDEDFLLVQYKIGINIFLINIEVGTVNVEVPPSGIRSEIELELNYHDEQFRNDRMNIVILYHYNLHFELLVKVDEKTQTMHRLFESSDPIILQLRSAFAKERAKRRKMNLIT